jgi:benzylsuccinate CoA-transferase BbsE subunit
MAVAREKVFRCANGYVSLYLTGAGPFLRTSNEIVRWMDEHGAAPEWLKKVDFTDWVTERFTTEETTELKTVIRACEAAVAEFLQRFTRQEIYAFALERNLLIAPVATVEDLAADKQLASRDYFQTVDYPALGTELTLVGPFAKLSASPVVPPRPSPTLGEHNEEILSGELGVTQDDMQRLFAQRVL